MKAPKCEGGGIKRSVSDMSVMNKKAECPVCCKHVRISIPDRKNHGNIAKFSSHTKE